MREQTFAEREAEFNASWQKKMDNINKWENLRAEPTQQPDRSITIASTLTVPDSLKPIHVPRSKSVVHIGDKIERTAERKAERAFQATAVLKAFINAPNGFTDQELVARGIGGSDGPRRRRFLRSEWSIDFNVRKDASGLKRYSITDVDHAKKVLAAGKRVEKSL
jgi:hypothetical protein